MTTAEQVALVVTDEDMGTPQIVPFAEGRAAIFSARSPDKRSANQDAAGLLALDGERGVLVVADGLGGQPGGDSASKITLGCLETAVRHASEHGTPMRGAILDALENANRRVMELGIGAATTFAALEVAGATLRPYHVGDSGILVVGQRRKVKLQTISHSPVGYAVEAGLLDEHEAMHHDDRHVVSNMVGAADMRIEVGSPIRLAPRDTALLATDGLFDNLNPAEVVDIVRTGPLDRAANDLARRTAERMRAPAAQGPSKPDDLTFVLYRRDARSSKAD
jgi:serine/threonine protein phosphatase PrpC